MGGRIVHTGWVTTIPKHEPYLRRKLILQAGDIFLYDHYTQPSHRSLGLARARDVHVLHHYREKGYRRSLAIVAVENRSPSVRSKHWVTVPSACSNASGSALGSGRGKRDGAKTLSPFRRKQARESDRMMTGPFNKIYGNIGTFVNLSKPR